MNEGTQNSTASGEERTDGRFYGENSPFSPIGEVLDDIRAGKMVIVCDDEDRENEGDLTVAAELVTAEHINFMATHARGLICLPMAGELIDKLEIPPMARQNTERLGTAFTASIEARDGCTTGISAADRAHTCRVAVADDSGPEDIVMPGGDVREGMKRVIDAGRSALQR